MIKGNELTIQVKKNSRMMLLAGSFVLALVGVLTSEFIGTEDSWATVVLASAFFSIFAFILWINSNFERLIINEKEISYRFFLFVSRRAKFDQIDGVTIGERSGAVRFIVKGRKFASLNSSIIDVERKDLLAYLKRRNISV